MRHGLPSILGIFFALLYWGTSASHAARMQQEPRVVILEADPNRSIARTLQMADFAFSLTLENQNTEVEIGDLVITVGPLARADGVVDAGSTLSFAISGQAASPIVLRPGERRLLTVSGRLPQQSQYTSWLSLAQADRFDVYPLILTRVAVPGLDILNLGSDSRLTLQSSSDESTHAVTVQLPSGQAAIDQLGVAVGELSREDGQPIADAKLSYSVSQSTSLSLKPDAPLMLQLVAKGLQVGTYASSLRFTYSGQTQIVSVRITRTALATNLQVDQPATVALVRSFTGDSEAQVPIIVRETSGKALPIYYPVLSKLESIDSNGKRVSVATSNVQLFQRDSSGKLTAIPTSPNTTANIPFNQDVVFVYEIKGLRHGTYSGQVAISGPESTRVTTDFTVTVKDHWFWPFVWLLVGVLVAYALTEWIDVGRGRALRGVKITEEIEVIERRMPQSSQSNTVWNGLQDELRQLYRKNWWNIFAATEIETNLEGLRARRQIYERALAAVGQITDFVAHYLPGEKATYQTKLEEALNDVVSKVRAADTAAADREAALLVLQNVRLEVQQEAIKRPAKHLQTQVQKISQESQDLMTKAQALNTKIQEVISQAQTGNINDLLDQLHQYRADYVYLSLDQLKGLLAQLAIERREAIQRVAAQSSVVDEQTGRARDLLAEGRGLLERDDADGALARLSQARVHYLGALIYHLRLLTSEAGRPDDISEAKWHDIRNQTPQLTHNVTAALEHWNKGQFDQAQERYENAYDEYVTILAAILSYRLDNARALIQVKPAGIDTTVWDSLMRDLVDEAVKDIRVANGALPQAKAPAEERWRRYRESQDKAITAQIKLMSGLYKRLQAYTDSNPLTDDLKRDLEDLNIAIEKAQDALPRDDREAENLLYRSQHMYIDLVTKIQPPQSGYAQAGKSSTPSSTTVVLPTASLAVLRRSPIPLADAGPWRLAPQQLTDIVVYEAQPSSARQLRNIAMRGLVYLGIVMFIAALTGLQALWINRAVFGGADYITAFLWGFGTSGTAAGFSSLAQRYHLPGNEKATTDRA
jgi:hypothetical protein